MDIKTISELPTCVNNIHESVLRAYQILERTKEFLRKGVPSDIILELIEEMEIDTEMRSFGC